MWVGFVNAQLGLMLKSTIHAWYSKRILLSEWRVLAKQAASWASYFTHLLTPVMPVGFFVFLIFFFFCIHIVIVLVVVTIFISTLIILDDYHHLCHFTIRLNTIGFPEVDIRIRNVLLCQHEPC